MKYGAFFLVFLLGCGTSSSWRYDSIANDRSAFESARLVYQDPASHVKLEFLKVDDHISAFLFLTHHRFTASQNRLVEVTLSIEDQQFKESLPYHEGRMRLALSPELATKLIFALQEGKTVGILVDGFRGTISPDQFDPFYNKLLNGDTDWLKFIKGPL